jgi:hypothetical protein
MVKGSSRCGRHFGRRRGRTRQRRLQPGAIGRARQAAKDALVGMGVAPDRIAFATGWGKLYPVCTQTDESCWSQNRRTHFYTWPPVENATSVASRGNSPAITPE